MYDTETFILVSTFHNIWVINTFKDQPWKSFLSSSAGADIIMRTGWFELIKQLFPDKKVVQLSFLRFRSANKGFLNKENNIDLIEIAQQLYQLNKLAFLKFEVCIVWSAVSESPQTKKQCCLKAKQMCTNLCWTDWFHRDRFQTDQFQRYKDKMYTVHESIWS